MPAQRSTVHFRSCADLTKFGARALFRSGPTSPSLVRSRPGLARAQSSHEAETALQRAVALKPCKQRCGAGPKAFISKELARGPVIAAPATFRCFKTRRRLDSERIGSSNGERFDTNQFNFQRLVEAWLTDGGVIHSLSAIRATPRQNPAFTPVGRGCSSLPEGSLRLR